MRSTGHLPVDLPAMDVPWSPVWVALIATVTAATVLAGGWLLARRPRPAAPAAATPDPAGLDVISGLPGRPAFERALEDAAQQADRVQGALVMAYLDIDHFRLVNEAYGHATGDRLLKALPARLRQAVPTLMAAMRNAGDEFALLLPGGHEQAQDAARRLREVLRQPFVIDGHELRIDASIGLALYPQHGSAPRLLMQAAAAMRAVKQAGGGGHAEFEASMGVDMRQRAELLRDLRQAVAQQRLQLVYQPKVDAGTLEVTAAEALLRWHDPQRGVVPPAVFVPLAEKNGLIGDIGRWVVDEACRQAAQWRAAGLRMRVAINVSGHQLRTDGWVEHLCGSLRRHGVPPERFTCEITESVAMEDTAVTRAAFERLREAGVHVSIDDFGTGQSSLAALRKLPAAELKIDRSFITDLETSADARAIVSTIVRMGHRLQLRVVAEGVETEAQRDALQSMGCDELQGFLFAKPLSATALALWADGGGGPCDPGFRESLFQETTQQAEPPT